MSSQKGTIQWIFFPMLLLQNQSDARDYYYVTPAFMLPKETSLKKSQLWSVLDKEQPSVVPDSLCRRRKVLHIASSGIASAFLGQHVPSAYAGEVGARITRAVTQSDVGISVRRSVVRGAQVFDQIDGSWEQFSDRFGLGSERNKVPGRPKAKNIPDPLPLDIATAQSIVKLSDAVFLSTSGIPATELDREIEKVANLVKPSFLRSQRQQNVNENSLDYIADKIQNSNQFNFASYVHFKAYSNLLLQSKGFAFQSFRTNFENELGKRLVTLLLPPDALIIKKSSSNDNDINAEVVLTEILKQVDQLCQALQARGLVALTERNQPDEDQIADWIDDIASLYLSIALDGDITLGSQMLLQEQGYRLLYPNYGRFALVYLFRQMNDQQVTADDYYFDTDYNSDPEKFQVKEVLVNIVLENN